MSETDTGRTDIGANANLEMQVMNVTPDGCYNPLAHVTHLSTGTFKCGACEDDVDHLRVTMTIALTELGGQELTLNLVDEDAVAFATKVMDLFAQPAFKARAS